MPKPTIEQLEAEKKKAAAELEKAMQKKEQLEHQMSRLLNRDKQAERKARTRRLIERGAILESVFPETADLSGEEAVAPHPRGAGDAGLGRGYGVFADLDVVSDLNQVVELDAPADHRRIGLGAVDAGVGPDLYVVFDHHVAQLRNLVETARGVGHEAETVGADHGSRVQDAVAADPAAFVYLDSGVEDRAFAHRNPRSEVNLRIDLAVLADFHARFDHREIPDVAVGAHLGLFSDRRISTNI